MTRIKRTTEAVESKAKCTFSLDCTPQTGSSRISFYDARQWKEIITASYYRYIEVARTIIGEVLSKQA